MTPSDWAAVGLSLRVAGAATLLALGPSLALGWFLAGRRGVLARGVEFVVFLPLVVPPVVTGYALLAVLPRSVAFTGAAAVLASAVVGLPLFVQLARVGFEGVRPDVLDAARVDGAGGRWAVASWSRWPPLPSRRAPRSTSRGGSASSGRRWWWPATSPDEPRRCRWRCTAGSSRSAARRRRSGWRSRPSRWRR
mgnify:CR=1 FL=1